MRHTVCSRARLACVVSLLALGRATAAAEALDPVDPTAPDTTATAPRASVAAPPDPTPAPDAAPGGRWIGLRVGEILVGDGAYYDRGQFGLRGQAVGLAVRWRLSRWLGVELGPEYQGFSATGPEEQISFTDLSIATSLRAQARAWALELAAYLGGSLHYTRMRESFTYTVPVSPWPDSNTVQGTSSSSDAHAGFGILTGVGVGYPLSPGAVLGADLRLAVVRTRPFAPGYFQQRRMAGVTLSWSL